MQRYKYSFLLIATMLLLACGPSIPKNYSESSEQVAIYPDYRDVTIPPNLAPLTFSLDEPSTASVLQLTSGEATILLEGPHFTPTPGEWSKLCNASDLIKAQIYTRSRDGQWTQWKSFNITVSSDSIDPYIAYRLISPSYVTYEDLTICQRDLQTYEEKVIYGNMINATEATGHCINCHAFQQGNPKRFQFHIRQHQAGTLISYDGKNRKVSLRGDSTLSAGVYPAWHPTKPLIAYSTNLTSQTFHTTDLQKIEVQDAYSDLILYDLQNDRITSLPCDSDDLDCFPTWSPDGKFLYYCSAHYVHRDSSLSRQMDMIRNYEKIHYNLYRRPFNIENMKFGPRELIYNADSLGKSATLPRISPDGRFLLFTQAPFGIFHIWHTQADLFLMDLNTSATRPLDEVNSPQAESYHSWSSNGRWIIFSSRRDDGNFTRLFLAHCDNNGKMGKPVEVPTRDPQYNRQFLKSYNVPEFITGSISTTPQELAAIIANE